MKPEEMKPGDRIDYAVGEVPPITVQTSRHLPIVMEVFRTLEKKERGGVEQKLYEHACAHLAKLMSFVVSVDVPMAHVNDGQDTHCILDLNFPCVSPTDPGWWVNQEGLVVLVRKSTGAPEVLYFNDYWNNYLGFGLERLPKSRWRKVAGICELRNS